MALGVEGIDLAQTALSNEYRISVLEGILELLVSRIGGIDQSEVEEIREKAIQELQEKYPEAGVEITDDE